MSKPTINFSILTFIYICTTQFEANHNKDYSVVKTFKIAPPKSGVVFFGFSYMRWNKIYKSSLGWQRGCPRIFKKRREILRGHKKSPNC